ncbi:MAG: TetR/AcrR family transcriptional regulator [Chloroflexi bacterium]|nr:TetR/AcrR family transcriptional regulator [Chloroflexota bacterium]
MGSKRDDILETTCQLLEIQGYHATGLNQIIAQSGAPKGSLYYYFPDGKEELTAEAIHRAGRTLSQRIGNGLAQHHEAAGAVSDFVQRIAQAVESSGFQGGGPLTTVALETATSSERINLACREAYRQLQQAFEEKLAASGFPPQRAAQLATFITAAIEGAIILSRTQHSGDPLRLVADELERLLAAESAA